MPVRTLFEMTLGQTLFLNAKLPTGKEFTPREISHLIGDEGNPAQHSGGAGRGRNAAAV